VRIGGHGRHQQECGRDGHGVEPIVQGVGVLVVGSGTSRAAIGSRRAAVAGDERRLQQRTTRLQQRTTRLQQRATRLQQRTTLPAIAGDPPPVGLVEPVGPGRPPSGDVVGEGVAVQQEKGFSAGRRR
jgi:hypothetical protein